MTFGSVVAAAHAWHTAGQRQVPARFMFGRPPQVFLAHAWQLPKGSFPARSGSAGTPAAARFRAAVRWGFPAGGMPWGGMVVRSGVMLEVSCVLLEGQGEPGGRGLVVRGARPGVSRR